MSNPILKDAARQRKVEQANTSRSLRLPLAQAPSAERAQWASTDESSPGPRQATNASWKENFLLCLMGMVALGCLGLFARSIGIGSSWLGQPWSSDFERWVAFLLVLAAVLAPFLLLWDEIRQRTQRRSSRQKKDPERGDEVEEDSLLHFAVHFVPYGILALAMLLENDRLRRADGEGLAAVASIMILFALAELGLYIFTNIQKARIASDQLAAVLQEEQKRLKGMPWADLYSRILRATLAPFGSIKLELNARIEKLLLAYVAFLERGANERHPTSAHLSRTFLDTYLAEELRDLRGRTDPESVPGSVSPPSDRQYEIAYFATNVGFYARFLEAAVLLLGKIGHSETPRQMAHIAVITNALPSQLWNWPMDDRYGCRYAPIEAYRKAQAAGVKSGNLKVFRIVLVGPEEDAAEVKPNETLPTRSSALNSLWSKGEWRRQSDWFLVFNKGRGDDDEPLKYKDVKTETVEVLKHLPPHLRNAAEPSSPSSRGDFYVMSTATGAHLMDAFTLVPVWRQYCNEIHGENRAIGRTDVYAVTPDVFNANLPEGFNRYSDLMFLGVADGNIDDIWADDAAGVHWSMALLSSMSTATQTMFLSLMSNPVDVDHLWKQVSRAKRDKLQNPLVTSFQAP